MGISAWPICRILLVSKMTLKLLITVDIFKLISIGKVKVTRGGSVTRLSLGYILIGTCLVLGLQELSLWKVRLVTSRMDGLRREERPKAMWSLEIGWVE